MSAGHPERATDPGRREWRWPVALFALAVAVRLGPVVAAGLLTGRLEYDDGVYYAASVNLWSGRLPYRDIVFLHPPVIAVLLSPFSLAARLIGDVPAMAAARVAFCAIGALNAVLVWQYLRRYGPRAAACGGLLYAVWRLPAITEHTVMLEPLLALALLGSVLLLDPPDGAAAGRLRVIGSGVIVGLAIGVKLWMAPLVVVLAGFVAITRTRRAVGDWLLGVSVAVVVGVGPFALAAPARAARMMITDQSGRGADALGWARLTRLDEVAGLGGLLSPESRTDNPPLTFVVLTVLAWSLRLAVRHRRQWIAGPRLWAVIAIVQVTMTLAAPVAYYHYLAWAAPALAILLGHAVARAWDPAVLRVPRWLAAAPVIGLLVLLAASSRVIIWPAPHAGAGLVRWAAPYRCVSSTWASWVVAANAYSRQVGRGCPSVVDDYAVLLDSGSDVTYDVATATRDSAAAQAALSARLRGSDAVILPSVLAEAGLDGTTQPYLLSNFRQVAGDGDVAVWARVRAR